VWRNNFHTGAVIAWVRRAAPRRLVRTIRSCRVKDSSNSQAVIGVSMLARTLHSWFCKNSA
jgi:hypothetical protein